MSTIIFDEPFGKERKVDESTDMKKIEEESEESLMLFRRPGQEKAPVLIDNHGGMDIPDQRELPKIGKSKKNKKKSKREPQNGSSDES